MHRSLAALAVLLATHSVLAADEPVEVVDVRVTHLAKDAGWRVQYRLERPADQLRFFQDFLGRRASKWRAGDGMEIVKEDGMEFLRRKDRDPILEATVEFASDVEKFDRLYPLNQRFSDRS